MPRLGTRAPVMPGHGTAVARLPWRPTVPISLARAERATLALADSPLGEPHRVVRRLRPLRGWSHVRAETSGEVSG